MITVGKQGCKDHQVRTERRDHQVRTVRTERRDHQVRTVRMERQVRTVLTVRTLAGVHRQQGL